MGIEVDLFQAGDEGRRDLEEAFAERADVFGLVVGGYNHLELFPIKGACLRFCPSLSQFHCPRKKLRRTRTALDEALNLKFC